MGRDRERESGRRGREAGVREERAGSGSPGGEDGKRESGRRGREAGAEIKRRSFVDYYCSSLVKNQYPANNPGNGQFCL